MGAAHSKRRSSRETYRRFWVGKLCNPPKGRRWTKPSAVVLLLETVGLRERTISVLPLLDYARKCRDTLSIPKIAGGVGYSSKTSRGDKGNVFLEYAFVQFKKKGRVMSEADIMVAQQDGKIGNWYDSLKSARVSKKVEVVLGVKNKKAVKRFFKRNKLKAESEAERMKRVGDEVRAKAVESANRQRKQAVEINAELALIAKFKGQLS